MSPTSNNFNERDLTLFGRFGIPLQHLDRNGVRRVSDVEARLEYGFTQTGDLAGILFPYYNGDAKPAYYRIRRDRPEIGAGNKALNKYVARYGDRRRLYYLIPGTQSADSIIILVEAEKSALALAAWSERTNFKLTPIAMGGCWGWRGTIGKVEAPAGGLTDQKGPLPDLYVCHDREVVVMLDNNTSSNLSVRAARSALTAELLAMGARVRIAELHPSEGKNGPDDFLIAGDEASRGLADELMRGFIQGAIPAEQIAIEDAKHAIARVREDKSNTDLIRAALDAIAAITDPMKRELVGSELSSMLRGVLTKARILTEVRHQVERQQEQAEELKQAVERADLMSQPVNPQQLVNDLERFFTDRAYLPDGAALVLSYFVLNAYTYDIFDTTPYTSLESAVPGCGKSTTLELLAALCPRARKATSLTEATLFRIIDAERPVLLIDEARVLESNSERGDLLRQILNEGYKRGGKVPRCVGEDNEVRWFDVYCPKAIAEIGGLTGALLDRCIVIHMEKPPKGHVRKSTRTRTLKRDAHALIEQLKGYALQALVTLGQLYANEPDEGYWPKIENREAELYGPLLTHAKLIGPEAEKRLLAAVEKFTLAKADIKAAEWDTAKMVAILEVLQRRSGDTFTPADLVEELEEYEVWAPSFSKVKGDDKAQRRGKSAKVGYFLKRFRVPSRKGVHRVEYNLQDTIDIIRRHVPEKPSEPSEPSDSKPSDVLTPKESTGSDTSDTSEGFTGSSTEGNSGPENLRQNGNDDGRTAPTGPTRFTRYRWQLVKHDGEHGNFFSAPWGQACGRCYPFHDEGSSAS